MKYMINDVETDGTLAGVGQVAYQGSTVSGGYTLESSFWRDQFTCDCVIGKMEAVPAPGYRFVRWGPAVFTVDSSGSSSGPTDVQVDPSPVDGSDGDNPPERSMDPAGYVLNPDVSYISWDPDSEYFVGYKQVRRDDRLDAAYHLMCGDRHVAVHSTWIGGEPSPPETSFDTTWSSIRKSVSVYFDKVKVRVRFFVDLSGFGGQRELVRTEYVNAWGDTLSIPNLVSGVYAAGGRDSAWWEAQGYAFLRLWQLDRGGGSIPEYWSQGSSVEVPNPGGNGDAAGYENLDLLAVFRKCTGRLLSSGGSGCRLVVTAKDHPKLLLRDGDAGR